MWDNRITWKYLKRHPEYSYSSNRYLEPPDAHIARVNINAKPHLKSACASR